jgi:hypothetical protein
MGIIALKFFWRGIKNVFLKFKLELLLLFIDDKDEDKFG